MRKLQPLQESTGAKIEKDADGRKYLSLYNGELTEGCFAKNMLKIKQSFPTLPEDWYDVFFERLKAKNIGDIRLTDAVNHVVDTCDFSKPTIAKFLNFDRKAEVFTYQEICRKVHDGDSFENYQRFEMNGKPYYRQK